MKSEKLKTSYVHPRDSSYSYVNFTEIPQDQQKPLLDWLEKNEVACAFVEEEDRKLGGRPQLCIASWDYELWYDYWIRDEEASIE